MHQHTRRIIPISPLEYYHVRYRARSAKPIASQATMNKPVKTEQGRNVGRRWKGPGSRWGFLAKRRKLNNQPRPRSSPFTLSYVPFSLCAVDSTLFKY